MKAKSAKDHRDSGTWQLQLRASVPPPGYVEFELGRKSARFIIVAVALISLNTSHHQRNKRTRTCMFLPPWDLQCRKPHSPRL